MIGAGVVFYNPETLKPYVDVRRPWHHTVEAASKKLDLDVDLLVKDLRPAFGIKLAMKGAEIDHA